MGSGHPVSATFFAVVLWTALAPARTLAAVDHAPFFPAPLKDGPSVTARCLECHPEAAPQVMATTHWTWSSKQEVKGRGVAELGKKNAINNYCISVITNWRRCTSCHVGYGWRDASFDFSDPERVDCLVCHDTTGTYRKDPEGSGHPVSQSCTWSPPGPSEESSPPKGPHSGMSLMKVAQSVGRSSRTTCGACHFFGGGGDGVKHGDLDTSMIAPNSSYDVHMGVDGLDFSCVACHRTEGHRIRGSAMVVSPGGRNQVACTDCHAAVPHGDALLDQHVDRVACQTCHIPAFAKVQPTNTWWDWSAAGETREVSPGPSGRPTYDKKKGELRWQQGIRPHYAWYDGTAGVYLLGDRIDPKTATRLNWPQGARGDPGAKIYPFKIHRGRQIYDKKHGYLAVATLVGWKGYWQTFDWQRAVESGMKAAGLPFSGEYAFAETVMFWRVNHMVAPARDALGCADCHGQGDRMDWADLGYPGDPARSNVGP